MCLLFVLARLFARLGDDLGSRDEVSGVVFLHVLAVVPRRQTLPEEDCVRPLHALTADRFRHEVCRLAPGGDEVERDGVAGDVLAGVVQVHFQVPETAFAGVAVAQPDSGGIVLKDRCGRALGVPQQVLQVPKVLCLHDAVGQCQVLGLGRGGCHQALLRRYSVHGCVVDHEDKTRVRLAGLDVVGEVCVAESNELVGCHKCGHLSRADGWVDHVVPPVAQAVVARQDDVLENVHERCRVRGRGGCEDAGLLGGVEREVRAVGDCQPVNGSYACAVGLLFPGSHDRLASDRSRVQSGAGFRERRFRGQGDVEWDAEARRYLFDVAFVPQRV